jgi:hypothetical protein
MLALTERHLEAANIISRTTASAHDVDAKMASFASNDSLDALERSN